MSNYTKTTDFEAKDSLPSGDSGKIIRGSEFETEFDNIATAIASKSDANNPTFTGTVTIDGLTVNGNTVLGNAATDTVTVTADIASNLLPSADDTYNLGAVGAEWNDLHVDGVAYIDTIAGFATTENVTFGDNDKAIFGAGSDLQIFHDGSNSYITDTGTGDLQIKGTQLSLKGANNEAFLYAIENGPVRIYHDNAEKLITTSTGIDVTGTVTADGLTVYKSGSGDAEVVIRPSDSSGDPVLKLKENSASTRLTIRSDESDGAKVKFQTGNTEVTRLAFGQSGDISFYEDTGTTAKFFWDASAEQLKLGTIEGAAGGSFVAKTDSNGYALAIEENSGTERWSVGVDVDGDLGFFNSTDTTASVTFDDSGNVGIGTDSPSRDLSLNSSGTTTLQVTNDTVGTSTTDGFQIKHYTSGATQLWSYENNYMAFATNNAERVRLDSSGNLLVGTTNTTHYATSTTSGHTLFANGTSAHSADGGTVGIFNRRTDDGTIAEFRKDGAAVGSIGTHNIASSSRLYVGSGDVNLMFRPDIEVIQPASNTGLRDAAISLGNASGRFKDLYLSGGLHGDTTFKNNAGTTEYARFNSSGNLLVGKISTGTTNVGTQITGDGFTSIVGTNNNIPLYLENKGTNGNCRISFANNSHGGASLGLNNGGDFTIFDSTASTTRFNVTSSRVITASGGIAGIELGGVGVGNRLDDYEEGTFTPVVTGSTTAGTGTYSSQSGTYTKVGQVVTCSFAVNMTAHDGAGNIRISLPFSSNTNAVGVVMDQNLNYGSGASLVAFTQNQEFVQLYAVGDNLAWDVQTLADDTAFTLFVTITYRA